MAEPPQTSITKSIDIISKLTVVAVLLPFALGVFIMNFHSARYGVRFLGFLETQYVLAGACFLFLYTIAAGSYFGLRPLYVNNTRKDSTLKGRLYNVGYFLFIASLWYTALLLPVNLLTDWQYGPLRGALLCTPMALAIRLMHLIAIEISDLVSRKRSGEDAKQLLEGAMIRVPWYGMVACMFLVSISIHSYYLFPHIAHAFGGGRPEQAEILVTREATEIVAILGYTFLPESTNTGRVRIILETDDYLLLEPPDGHPGVVKSIRVPKAYVAAVFYIDDRQQLDR